MNTHTITTPVHAQDKTNNNNKYLQKNITEGF